MCLNLIPLRGFPHSLKDTRAFLDRICQTKSRVAKYPVNLVSGGFGYPPGTWTRVQGGFGFFVVSIYSSIFEYFSLKMFLHRLVNCDNIFLFGTKKSCRDCNKIMHIAHET